MGDKVLNFLFPAPYTWNQRDSRPQLCRYLQPRWRRRGGLLKGFPVDFDGFSFLAGIF